MKNIRASTIEGFGDKWSLLDQNCLISNKMELNQVWENYFFIFPWQSLPESAIGFD